MDTDNESVLCGMDRTSNKPNLQFLSASDQLGMWILNIWKPLTNSDMLRWTIFAKASIQPSAKDKQQSLEELPEFLFSYNTIRC